MPRPAGHTTDVGKRLTSGLQRAQAAVGSAVRRRDMLAVEALEQGLGIRGVAAALEIDTTTAQRRYGRRQGR